MLVGRETERRAISDLLAAGRVGNSGALVLTGEAGIGKTTLLEEAARLASSMRLLRAQGLESEQSVPFGGLLQIAHPLLPLLPHIPVPQAKALGSALLLETDDDAPVSRFAVGAATLSLLSRAAEDQPLAVLVDDAHLLDRPSADALVFAARRMVSDAVAVLVAVRSGEPGSRLWDGLPTITVPGLDLPAARELLARAAGADVGTTTAARLHRATAGNPLALLELGADVERLEALPPDIPVAIPDQLTRFFVRRIAELSPAARTSLLVASADSANLGQVHEVCRRLGLEGARLAEAEDAGLITTSDDRVRFRHPLVRSAVYGAADPGTRRSVHRAFAAVVPEAESDRLAWHLSEGAVAPDEPTAATLDQVAVQASARGAFAIAANASERAAQLTVDPHRMVGRLALAAESAWLAGLTDRSVALLDRALECHPEPRLRARLLERRGEVETRCGSLDSALATLLQAAHDVERLEPVTAIRLLSDAVHVCFYLEDPRSALGAAKSIETMLHRTVDRHAGFLGSMAIGMAMILAGSGHKGPQRLRQAVAMMDAAGDPARDPLRLRHRVIGPLWLRDTRQSRRLAGEAVIELRRQAALGALPSLLMHLARDDATTDRWGDAEAGYLEAVRLAAETGQTTDQAVSAAGLAWLYARQGRQRECREQVRAADEPCRTRHIRLGTAWLEFAQGDLEFGLGNVAGAIDHYERLEGLLESCGLADPDQWPAAELVEAYLHVSRPEAAQRAVRLFRPKAESKGQPWSLARLHRALGLCQRDVASEAHFAAALELHRETPDAYEAARTELAYGAWLRRMRRRVDARPLLRSALTTFEMLGAAPWADRAARELQATGETANRRRTSPLEELTPQERQISQLLADGRTTRETAAALFLSPKTVEYHLRHVYLKLGIKSREALAEIFAG